MKTIILPTLLSLGIFFISCEKKPSDSIKTDTLSVSKSEETKTNEEAITFLKSLSKTDILTKFFNPYKIINDTALWKQDLESIEMTVSADGYLHTVIDSIYYINNQVLIVFKTYEIEKNGLVDDCHACGVGYSIALIEKENENYSIVRFKKYLTSIGSWGQGPTGEIVVFKKNLETLKLAGGWTGTGSVMNNEEYFNIHDFSNVFSLETYHSNEGMCDEKDFKCINKTERKLIPFTKHPSNKPAIIIQYKHTYFDKKVILIEKSDTLIYDGYHFNKDVYYEGV